MNHRFKVVHATSEDPDYPASQLNTVNPTTKGWQSVRFCNFPQELLFEMVDGDVLISQIQVLSHQFKISSKIEIFIGSGNSPATATFKRLGYLSLDSNERSDYQARELKTVYINKSGTFLKLVLNENHPNKHNIYNQVGIIAVSLIGSDISEAKATPRSSDAPKKAAVKNPYTDITVDMNLDPKTATKLRQLAEAKSHAIQNEDYLTAKQIKQVESDLKAMGSRLAQLDLAKSEAVEAEDYDLAKEIKDQSDNLRMQIEQKVNEIIAV
jgi:centrosomal protein CEP104